MSFRNRHFALISTAVAVWGLVLSLAACGPKRPSAVPTTPAGSGLGADSMPSSNLDDMSGSDIQSIGTDSPYGEDIYGTDGEGGPLDDVHFAFNEFSLSDEARTVLERNAAWLQARRGLHVVVEGHCDERGTVDYNLALGERRSLAARDYLVSLGVDPARLTVVSYGKERPLDAGHTEEAWARNRRAHFAIRR